MKRSHKEIETREVEVVDDVICNKCGCSCKAKPPKTWDDCWLEIKASWGYGSTKDCTIQTAHLCEACWDAFCASFSVPVESYNYVNGDVSPEPKEVQLALFTSDEMSGDPYQMKGQCGYEPNHESYDRCTRDRHHEGPCAHPFKPLSPLL